jgi:hypothetical protein
MKTKTISVSYGQTQPGTRQFESERFDLTITMEMESENEQDPKKVQKIAKRLLEEARLAVESKSGKKMRRGETST